MQKKEFMRRQTQFLSAPKQKTPSGKSEITRRIVETFLNNNKIVIKLNWENITGNGHWNKAFVYCSDFRKIHVISKVLEEIHVGSRLLQITTSLKNHSKEQNKQTIFVPSCQMASIVISDLEKLALPLIAKSTSPRGSRVDSLGPRGSSEVHCGPIFFSELSFEIAATPPKSILLGNCCSSHFGDFLGPGRDIADSNHTRASMDSPGIHVHPWTWKLQE